MNGRQHEIYVSTLTGSAVNVGLTAIKFIAGIAGRSSAMIADAVHSLSDLISDAIVLLFVRIAGKPEDCDHSYGHGKYETLATVVIGLLLGAVGLGILVDSSVGVVGFIHGTPLDSPNWWALGAAIVSILSKEWLYRYTAGVATRIDSPVLMANAWHHRSDAFTSVATLAGIAGAMFLGPGWRVLDPLAAAFVSIFIIVEAVKLMKPALDELLEKSLDAQSLSEIERTVMSVDGVTAYHHLRTRRIGDRVAISLHLKMHGSMTLFEAHAIATEVENRLRKEFGGNAVLAVHMEPDSPGSAPQNPNCPAP